MEPTRSYRESGPNRDGGPTRAVRRGSRRDMAGGGSEAVPRVVCSLLWGHGAPGGAWSENKGKRVKKIERKQQLCRPELACEVYLVCFWSCVCWF